MDKQFVLDIFLCSFSEKGAVFGNFDGHLCVGYNVRTLGHLSKASLPKKVLHLVAGSQQGSSVSS